MYDENSENSGKTRSSMTHMLSSMITPISGLSIQNTFEPTTQKNTTKKIPMDPSIFA